MQIPSTVLAKFSAKGKGYIEAALKMEQGYRLVEEAQLELDHLDGKKTHKKKNAPNNAGGDVVTNKIVDLMAKKLSPAEIAERATRVLKTGNKSTKELSGMIGCSMNLMRDALMATKKISMVGGGNQVKWTLRPTKSTIVKKTVANRTLKRKAPGKRPGWKPGNSIDDKSKYGDVLKAVRDANGWANKRILLKKTGLSINPLKRILAAMAKEKLVEEVEKKHNPTHKQPKNFERPAMYWVAV